MKDHLFVKESTDAEMLWVKSTRLAEFSHEISTLKAGIEIYKNARNKKEKE